MEPWYKVAMPRKEVREGRSFNPDEFAIALEQVVAGTAPQDYRDPKLFFSRTCFTRALNGGFWGLWGILGSGLRN
jgi:predicted AAA+ superfamily ATPase